MLEIFFAILKGITSVFAYFWWVFVVLFLIFAWQNKRRAKWVEEQESTLLHIKIPKTNDKDPTAAEMMFATLHGILKPKKEHIREGSIQEHISFEIMADHSTIQFYVWAPKHIKDFVEGQIYAQYPTAEITESKDYAKRLEEEGFLNEKSFAAAEISLEKEEFLPIKTFTNFHVDPLAGITGVLSKLDDKNEEIWIQILARPVESSWTKEGQDWVKKKKEGKTPLSSMEFGKVVEQPVKLLVDFIKIIFTGPLEPGSGGGKDVKLTAEDESKISGIQEKAEKLAYETKIRLLYVSSKDTSKARERIQAAIGAFKQFNTTNLNGFKGKKITNLNKFLTEYKNRLFLSNGYSLNIEELASIYHLPHTSVETPNINWTTFKTGEPPTNLPTIENTEVKDLAVFGETNFRGHLTQFGLKRDDRRRHMYIIGKSGMGKTKLQEILIEADIKNGEGVAIIDPHGDFTTDALNKIPKERINDVVVFDPSDVNFPIAFNPMEVIDEGLKIQTAAGIVGTFKKIFGYSWGPRLEYILNYTVLALLDTPDTTLLGIVRMLTDKNYRKKIVDNIKDPVVKKFWTTEFATYSDRFATEAIAPILNKVGQFVANSLIRNVIGQTKSSFNIREIMDKQKILLINLSTGKVGESNASLLGSLLITAIQLAAMSRADMPEEERKDFYLYVDEFQNFATESFNNILSEARKYRLGLIIANQYLGQIEESGVKDAVFGNVGTIVTFRVGANDATELVKEFSPPFEAQDIINLPRQHIYVRMTIDGQSETAFSGKTITVNTEDKAGNYDEILNNSREKYSKPRAEVESAIARTSGIDISDFAGEGGGSSQDKDEDNNDIDNEKGADFEAPILESAGNSKSKGAKSLSDVIKESTSHVGAPDKGKGKETKEEPKKKEEPQKDLKKELEETADYIIRHADGDNKYAFLPANKPAGLKPDEKGRKKGAEYKKNGKKIYDVKVDMYEPKDSTGFGEGKAPDVWVGELNDIILQLEAIKEGEGGGTKFIGIEGKDVRATQKLEEKINKLKGNKEKSTQIKDKIDKETLSAILAEVVKPNNKEEGESKKEKKEEPKEDKKENNKPKEEEKAKSPVSPKKEKIITPDNFKKIKEIHPHEEVKIVPKEIKEGEKIEF
ncbi:MAG: type IV secretion system DNA-binding domain-containing protein [Patescibacteria group bacterium]|nr:type IV secretion system DNA-binding domain-containing protein [Patescibacteria group bacterium]